MPKKGKGKRKVVDDGGDDAYLEAAYVLAMAEKAAQDAAAVRAREAADAEEAAFLAATPIELHPTSGMMMGPIKPKLLDKTPIPIKDLVKDSSGTRAAAQRQARLRRDAKRAMRKEGGGLSALEGLAGKSATSTAFDLDESESRYRARFIAWCFDHLVAGGYFRAAALGPSDVYAVRFDIREDPVLTRHKALDVAMIVHNHVVYSVSDTIDSPATDSLVARMRGREWIELAPGDVVRCMDAATQFPRTMLRLATRTLAFAPRYLSPESGIPCSVVMGHLRWPSFPAAAGPSVEDADVQPPLAPP